MIDIKLLRENPDKLQDSLNTKKFKVDVHKVLELDNIRRSKIKESESIRAMQKSANEKMASMEKGSNDFKIKLEELKDISKKYKNTEAQTKKAEAEFNQAFLEIPNIPNPDVPLGKHEDDNIVLREWGDISGFSYAKPHYDLSNFESMIDFKRGVKVAGAGFPFYIGDMALLVRSLVNFFLEKASENNYTEFIPPILVNPLSGMATGQLPDKEGQMYFDANEDLYMLPTAEISVTNFYRDEILDVADLPLYRCAYTPCFRREAGSWGADVRGLNRLHQFDKVELVKWTTAETSMDELDSLLLNVEKIIQELNIPYRVLNMCAGELGFPHSKQYDIEVFAAGQKKWLEVSSCSNFTDFQARRAGIRYRDNDGDLKIVHTINGSGLAVPRILAAIIENNLDENERIKVPSVLHKWTKKEYIF